MELQGRGRVRIGRLPWLPIHARMVHRLGHDYVGFIHVRLAGITVLPVIDAHAPPGLDQWPTGCGAGGPVIVRLTLAY